MEMETQNQVLTNQLSRVDAENQKLKDNCSTYKSTERGLRQNVLDLKHQISNSESRLREDNMMARINEAEASQRIAELQQKVAALESQHQEFVTAGQLGINRSGGGSGSGAGTPSGSGGGGGGAGGGSASSGSRDSELQEEVEQLRVNQKVEALHLNRKYLDAKYASKCASASDGEEAEAPKNPFEAMTISSMMTASSLGIFEDDDEVVDLAPAPPRTEEEEAEVNQLSLELNFARAELASLLNNDDD